MMNKQTLAILGLAILTISAITATSFDFDADTITNDENDILLNTSCTALVQTEKNYDVVILGSDSSAAFLVNSFGTTPSTVVSQSIDQSKQQLVIMTEDWVSHNADSSDVFNSILEQGNVVSLFNTSIEWSNIAYPISYPVETPVAYAMVVISGISYCFSELDCSVDEALESLITWTDSKSAGNHDILMDAGEHLGTGVETNDTYKTQFCHKSFNNSYNAYNNVSKSYVVQFPEARAWNIMIRY